MAQNYAFPLENGVWVNEHSTWAWWDGPLPTSVVEWIDQYSYSGGDTVINSTAYKKFDFTSSSGSNYHGAMREDSGRVFFVPADSLNEFLLYDFTLEIGDTVEVITQTVNDFPTSGLGGHYEIQQVALIDTVYVVVNGSLRRQLEIRNADDRKIIWLDGIGSLSGLYMSTWENISMYGILLACMSENDTVLVKDAMPLEVGSADVCDFTVGVSDLHSLGSNVRVYPNPASEEIHIVFDDQFLYGHDVRIYDLSGRMVYIQSLGTSVSQIQTMSWGRKGVYVLEIRNSEGNLIKVERIVLNP